MAMSRSSAVPGVRIGTNTCGIRVDSATGFYGGQTWGDKLQPARNYPIY